MLLIILNSSVNVDGLHQSPDRGGEGGRGQHSYCPMDMTLKLNSTPPPQTRT